MQKPIEIRIQVFKNPPMESLKFLKVIKYQTTAIKSLLILLNMTYK